ncbi:MAG: hypothetical protein IJU78_08910 [Clostridia bacterium]|nr:hypothetical protein [Clostridia bacterium]
MHTVNLSHGVNLKELLGKYEISLSSVACIKLGYDGNIYVLLSSHIPERIDGMFVNTVANSEYSALVLIADWQNEEIISHSLVKLGRYRMNFHFLQPIGDDFLLLGARCAYSKTRGPEMNAAIVNSSGEMLCEFCLGDGIEDCIVTADERIITSYFDEGVFGNYGWDSPIGSSGLVVWDRGGNVLWESKRNIYDCYAINLDERGRLWYYYYDEFKLVMTDLLTEKEYTPDIDGASGFLITADMGHIVFERGYDHNGEFSIAPILGERLGKFEPLQLACGDKPVSVSLFSFIGSFSVFSDAESTLYIKRFMF